MGTGCTRCIYSSGNITTNWSCDPNVVPNHVEQIEQNPKVDTLVQEVFESNQELNEVPREGVHEMPPHQVGEQVP